MALPANIFMIATKNDPGIFAGVIALATGCVEHLASPKCGIALGTNHWLV
jgi:hypothetical protein